MSEPGVQSVDPDAAAGLPEEGLSTQPGEVSAGIGLRGWSASWLNDLFGEMESRQVGIGAGGTVVLVCLLALFSIGLALRGAFGGDAFVAGAVTAVTASIVLFTAWPIARILLQAFQDGDGVFAPALVVERLAAPKIWSLRCLTGGGGCGVAWNTLFLALACGLGSTALGLAFALIVTRTGFAFKKTLRVLTVLPMPCMQAPCRSTRSMRWPSTFPLAGSSRAASVATSGWPPWKATPS